MAGAFWRNFGEGCLSAHFANMRLAIHHNQGSFSDRWIQYCHEHQISYTIVNCLGTSIIRELAAVDGLLWHWRHQDPAEVLAARHVIMAVRAMGVVVFPDVQTCWHFDDKIAQKYLLEAIDAPLAPTYVFYNLEHALSWIEDVTFPKVFKLRKGAGSQNVSLIRSRQEARVLAKRAFSTGFRPVPDYWNDAGKRYRVARRQGALWAALKRIPRSLNNIRLLNRMIGREKGYLYFQDFVPDNQFDTRVTVIGNRAFGYTRKVRPGDFRASGSGEIDYDPSNVCLECVRIAFEVTKKAGAQSMAFDFVRTPEGRPLIVEVSYCYVPDFVYNCPNHWDRQLNWHDGHMWPQDAILEDIVQNISCRDSSNWVITDQADNRSLSF